MNEEKTTIGEEIETIFLGYIRCIIIAVVGCYITFLGVTGILAFIFDDVEGIEAILSIVLGSIASLYGILLILVQLYHLSGLSSYCSEFAKTEITVKHD